MNQDTRTSRIKVSILQIIFRVTQDLIDSTLSVLVMKGINVNQIQIRNLLTQTSKVQNFTKLIDSKTIYFKIKLILKFKLQNFVISCKMRVLKFIKK
ncbi:unnamed protein product [Paramecium sonneborni]|uniref:Uncharacterized protein n=1 Tax=Paramecium sonneborni TaxID=65129 RepID=A0A8S1MNZ6_9CILI|nr:unnamed protein product [Paramecium sonneborni]